MHVGGGEGSIRGACEGVGGAYRIWWKPGLSV